MVILEASEQYLPKTTHCPATACRKGMYAEMKVKPRKLYDSNWLSSKGEPLDKLGQLVS